MTAPADINGTIPASTDAEAGLAYFTLGRDRTPTEPASYPGYNNGLHEGIVLQAAYTTGPAGLGPKIGASDEPTVDVAALPADLDRIGNLYEPGG